VKFDQTDAPLATLSPLQRTLVDALRGEIFVQLEKTKPANDPRCVIVVIDADGKPHTHLIRSSIDGGLNKALQAQAEIMSMVAHYDNAQAIGMTSCAWMKVQPADGSPLTYNGSLANDPARIEIIQTVLCVHHEPATSVTFELYRNPRKHPELGGCHLTGKTVGFIPDFFAVLLEASNAH
jgi:hypothetical protein